MTSHTLLHPLTSSSLPNLIRLLDAHGFDWKYLPRLLYIVGVCTLRQPVFLLESRRFRDRIGRQDISPPPLFIIGHWRSGTTFLQNLLSRDPRFGRVSLLQAAMPHDFLSLARVATRLLNHVLPDKRIMDNVALAPDMPWEEELAMAGICAHSSYHVSFFPRDATRIFNHAVFFDDRGVFQDESWKSCYTGFLRKVQFTQPDRRLLLKNPANTARIGSLRQLFPGCQFIYLHRHPYEVFTSTMHLYRCVLAAWGLQEFRPEDLREFVLDSYVQLLRAYLSQRLVLEAGRMVEIAMRDLGHRPIAAVQGIYDGLGLDDFHAAEPLFRVYVDSQKHYRKNQLTITDAEKDLVRERWAQAFSNFGYIP